MQAQGAHGHAFLHIVADKKTGLAPCFLAGISPEKSLRFEKLRVQYSAQRGSALGVVA